VAALPYRHLLLYLPWVVAQAVVRPLPVVVAELLLLVAVVERPLLAVVELHHPVAAVAIPRLRTSRRQMLPQYRNLAASY
jgi:hypothetical protein